MVRVTKKDEEPSARKAPRKRETGTASGQCLCGAVVLEIDVPVFWAWHDHSGPSRRAHGAAYATYVGAWRSKVRVVTGEAEITRFEDNGSSRRFCRRCGTPLIYERGRDKKMVNLPRALFTGRTGREPKYHIGIDQLQDWAYLGAPVGPLKGYPGVTVEKARKRPMGEAIARTAHRKNRQDEWD